jgi:hypothetical protein
VEFTVAYKENSSIVGTGRFTFPQYNNKYSAGGAFGMSFASISLDESVDVRFALYVDVTAARSAVTARAGGYLKASGIVSGNVKWGVGKGVKAFGIDRRELFDPIENEGVWWEGNLRIPW